MSNPYHLECVICQEQLASDAVGVTNPCGHPFHVRCFRQWEEIQRHRSASDRKVNCPTCKTRSSFIRVYIDFGQEDSMDDSASLSSLESHGKEETRQPKEDGEQDTAEGNDSLAAPQKFEKPKPVSDKSANGAQDPQDTAGVVVTDESPRGTSTSRTDESRTIKYRNLAKRLKKKVKFVESQRNKLIDQVRQSKKSHDDLQHELKALDQKLSKANNEAITQERKLEELRSEKAKLSHRLQKAHYDFNRIKSMEQEARLLKEKYQEDIQKARIDSLKEAKELADTNRKMCTETQQLRGLVEKQRQEIERFSQKADASISATRRLIDETSPDLCLGGYLQQIKSVAAHKKKINQEMKREHRANIKQQEMDTYRRKMAPQAPHGAKMAAVVASKLQQKTKRPVDGLLPGASHRPKRYKNPQSDFPKEDIMPPTLNLPASKARRSYKNNHRIAERNRELRKHTSFFS